MSQKIIFLRGLPASGKSTIARDFVKRNKKTARVNKDSIREMISFLKKNSKMRKGRDWHSAVIEIEREAARILLDRGFDVIVDDTNLTEKHYNFFQQLAKSKDCDFEVIDLRSVPIEECVKRDSQRDLSVGRGVIYSLADYGKLIDTKNKKVDIDVPYIVCDMDGTLCNINHRLHYVTGVYSDGSKVKNWNSGKDKDWNSFFDRMDNDIPNDHVVSLIKNVYGGMPVVIVTGRPESHRVPTENWLNFYGIEYEAVLMREINDHRPDDIVKQEILDKYLDKHLIKVVVDDRRRVIEMWERNGLNVINVGGKNNDF